MKFNKIAFILSGAALLVTSQSCKKYLDTNPDNRTEINTVAKVAQLVSTAYPTADYLTFAEAASDNTEEKAPGVGSLNQAFDVPYYWRDLGGSDTNTPGSYWNGCYEAIAAANQALQSIEQGNFGNEVLPYKGEALVARAYAHFMLAMFFAKPFEKGAANDSPGVPYVTEPETVAIKQYSRGTVKETYEKIEQDLLEGLPLLSASVYKVPKYHFTPIAANAFASRFYAFKEEWEKVIQHSSLTATGGDFINSMRPVSTTLYDMTYADHQNAYTRSDQKTAVLLGNCYSTHHYESSPNHGFGVKLALMYTAPNVSGRVLANKIGQYDAGNYTLSKYSGYFFYTGPGIGFPYLVMPLLTADESLMNRAEAYTQLGQYDLALKDLTDFLRVRIRNYASSDAVTLTKISNFYGTADPKAGLLKAILDSKKAEFLDEGIRWMDIVRHRLTVRHNVYTGLVENWVELKPDDPRRLFQLPNEVKLSGIALNPR